MEYKSWAEVQAEYGGSKGTSTVPVDRKFESWDEVQKAYAGYEPPKREEVVAPKAQGFAERNFEKQPTDLPSNEYMGYNAGRGGGSAFDFHVVTPKFKVSEEKGLVAAGKETFNVVSSVGEGLANTLNDLFDFGSNAIQKLRRGESLGKKDVVEGAAAGISAGASAANLAFTGISAELTAVEKSGIPILSQLAGGTNYVFNKLGQGGKWLAGKGVDNLPVSDETKNILRQPLEELGAIALPLLAAKGIEPLARKIGVNKEIVNTLVKGPDGRYMTVLGERPTTGARIAQGVDAVTRVAMAPISGTAKEIQQVYRRKVVEAKARGEDMNNPDTARKIVNETVKEVPAKVPGEMKIIKADETGKPIDKPPMIVATNQKLVLQNFIKGQEDINYKTVSDLGLSQDGSPITARFEWSYKNQEGTMYVTKGSSAADLAHELGHYFDRKLTADIGVRMSDIIPDYRNNSQEANALLASYAVEKLGGNASKRKVDSTVRELVGTFDKEVRKLTSGEKRGYGEKFAEAFREVISNPRKAQRIAPEFTKFIKSSTERSGIISKLAKAKTRAVEGRAKVEGERKQIEDYVKNKGTKFRLANENKKQVVPPELRSIAKESKKYKNPEEFIKSIGKDYFVHGSRADFAKFDPLLSGTGEGMNAWGKGMYVGDNISFVHDNYATQYGEGEGANLYLVPKKGLNILTLEESRSPQTWHRIANELRDNPEFNKERGIPELADKIDSALDQGKNKTDSYWDDGFIQDLNWDNYDIYDKVMKRIGVDGVGNLTPEMSRLTPGFDVAQNTGIVLYEPDTLPLIKTSKAELTKIYNQATKGGEEKFRTATATRKQSNLTKEQETELKKINQKIFGDENIKLVEQLLTPSGREALGSYKDKMIKILDGAADAKDTLYHEAVHKYMDVMLGMDEHVDLLRAGKEKFKENDLGKVEEKLAEDFIEYAKKREGVTGVIKRVFDKLIARAGKYFGNENKIEEFYQKILEGQPKTKPIPESAAPGIIFESQKVKPQAKPFKGEGIDTAAFNEGKINAPEDVVNFMKKVADSNDQYSKERRAATLDEMKQFAYKYLGDEKLYKEVPAQIRENIGRMKAAEQTMVDMATELQTELKTQDMSVISNAKMNEMVRKLKQLEAVSASFAGARTEASHLFASLKSEVTPGENQIMRELFTEMKKAGMDTANMETFFKEKGKAEKKILYETRGEAMMGVWYSFLLSGPTTFIKNAVSTAGSVVAETLSTGLRNPKEAISAIPDLMHGLMEGLGMAKEVALGNRPGAAELAREGKFTRTEKIPYEFQGKAAILNKLRLVGRLLAASDTVFNEGLRQMELSSLKSGGMPTPKEMLVLASNKAKAEGYRGEEAVSKAKEYVENPEILLGDLANEFALRGTFNSDPQGILGAVSRGIGEATRSKPVLKFLAPFTRVVANVLNRGIDYTPYGYTRAFSGEGILGGKGSELFGGKKGEALTARQTKQQLARATVGTLAMVFAYYLATQDRVTGDGPKDYKKKQQLMDAGWRPNSIKVGDTYIPIVNLGPLALPFALAANAHEGVKYNELKQKDWEGRVAAALSGSMATIFDMSFLSGVNNFMDVVKSDDPKKVQQFIGRTASGMVAPNFLKQVAKMFDPTLYQTDSVWEQILSDMRITGPLKPRLNVMGEEVKGDRLSQLQPSRESNDPVKQFLSKNQLWITVPAKTTEIKISGKDKRVMTPDEYYEYVKQSGPLIREQLERRMAFISRQKTREDQQKVVNDIVQDVRERVKIKIQREARKNNPSK